MRLEKEELAKQAIDREEAGIQAAKRRDAIERAQRMLYEDSDKVKRGGGGGEGGRRGRNVHDACWPRLLE